MLWTDNYERIDFYYRDDDGHLIFYYHDDYYNESRECDYVIKNGKYLTIYGNPWGDVDDIQVMQFSRK